MSRGIGMRKLLAVIVSLGVLAFSSCSLLETKALVRFQNATSDIQVNYGIGLGDAKYTGYFPPGTVTDYYETDSGTYSVQLKSQTGTWVTDSMGSYSVVAGHKYSLSVLGSYYSYRYVLTQDE